MPKKTEDLIEDEVRRRLSALASAAGISRGRIELEVLFMLPTEFVRMYRQLFDMALSDPVTPIGDGGKDEGRVKARGTARDPMKARSMSGATGGGKRFVAAVWPIRHEGALEAKRRLDKRLIHSVTKALQDAREASGVRENGQETDATNQCRVCGQFQSPKWVRCPFHDD
jgi:hypothetical protein